MKQLNPEKLHVNFLDINPAEKLIFPRYYTLTHSDLSGDLFLTIGDTYDKKQISGLYTRLMRDEVLAELLSNGDGFILRVHCHVSGGFVIGSAGWRYRIFQSELPLVLEAIGYGDRAIFEQKPELDNTIIYIHFQSKNKRFNKIENWGSIVKYR